MLIYVLNKDGKPLMPCSSSKARRLLSANKAIVADTYPFTIKLLYGTSGYKQPVSLGVDCGSKHIGISATTTKQELFSQQVELRSDIVKLLASRRQSRRTRRSRLRYRKARFNNRVSTKKKGWVAPSLQNKIDMHVRSIDFVYKILPVTRVILEIADFDIQKIKNPDIASVDYQQGDQLGFNNVREYVLCRDKHTCQNCHGKSGDKYLNVHHIETRQIGGNAPNNLITLCETCHEEYHLGKIKLKMKRGKSFRDASYMNIIKEYIYDKVSRKYGNAEITFGYITKYNRYKYCIDKSHTNDALVISGNFEANANDYMYLTKCIRRHNRQIHKMKICKHGLLKSNQAAYEVFGFRLWDLVKYNGEIHLLKSRRTKGGFELLKQDGTKLPYVNYKKITLLKRQQGRTMELLNK